MSGIRDRLARLWGLTEPQVTDERDPEDVPGIPPTPGFDPEGWKAQRSTASPLEAGVGRVPSADAGEDADHREPPPAWLADAEARLGAGPPPAAERRAPTPRRGGQRGEDSAPDDLLRPPEGALKVADAFFEGLLRRGRDR